MKNISILVFFTLLLSGLPKLILAQEAEHAEGHEERERSAFYVGSQRTWPFFSFLVDKGDDASTLGLELESYLTIGDYQIKNISYFEMNQFPRAIPGQPPGNPTGDTVAVNGINDLLMGFWFSKKGEHHGNIHTSWGFAAQLPTASSPTLGSEKWSFGPSVDFEYQSPNGRFFGGAIALQVWSIAGAEDRKDVSMLMIKPFAVYTLSDRFDLLYMPYGVSVYWNKKPGEKVYFPLGGGGQYKTALGTVDLNLGLQFFKNVIRPTKGTVYDLRFLVEFVF